MATQAGPICLSWCDDVDAAADRRVGLIEAEEHAGYHTTGRSAARWERNYGPQDVRVLTAQSRDFFEAPPGGFTETPLMHLRPTLLLAPASQRAAFAHLPSSAA